MTDTANDTTMAEDFTADCTENESFATKEANGENGAVEAVTKNGATENPIKEDERKLFVGGLSWETTEKDLREYFTQFGEIESVSVKTDPTTGRSRGFAFLVFTTVEGLDKVMNKSDHVISGKKVDPKKAKARQSKIFVGGLKPEISDEDIRSHFSTFGSVIEIEMPQDKLKNQRKGFCFITFDQEQVVQDLIRSGKTKINDIEVDVKKATPKPDGGRGGMRGGAPMRGGRGGRGGSWGAGWGGFGGYGGYAPGYGGYGGYEGYGGYGADYYGGYGGYAGYGGYDGYGYAGYGGYGGDGGFGGKQRGGRGGSRHQPY